MVVLSLYKIGKKVRFLPKLYFLKHKVLGIVFELWVFDKRGWELLVFEVWLWAVVGGAWAVRCNVGRL